MTFERIRIESDGLFEFRESLVVSFLNREGEPSRGMSFGQSAVKSQRLRTGGQNVLNCDILHVVVQV